LWKKHGGGISAQLVAYRHRQWLGGGFASTGAIAKGDAGELEENPAAMPFRLREVHPDNDSGAGARGKFAKYVKMSVRTVRYGERLGGLLRYYSRAA
jgi:hypothetical protein